MCHKMSLFYQYSILLQAILQSLLFWYFLIASLKHMQMNYIGLALAEMEIMANCQGPNQRDAFVTSHNVLKETYNMSILIIFV